MGTKVKLSSNQNIKNSDICKVTYMPNYKGLFFLKKNLYSLCSQTTDFLDVANIFPVNSFFHPSCGSLQLLQSYTGLWAASLINALFVWSQVCSCASFFLLQDYGLDSALCKAGYIYIFFLSLKVFFLHTFSTTCSLGVVMLLFLWDLQGTADLIHSKNVSNYCYLFKMMPSFLFSFIAILCVDP